MLMNRSRYILIVSAVIADIAIFSFLIRAILSFLGIQSPWMAIIASSLIIESIFILVYFFVNIVRDVKKITSSSS